MKILPIFPQGVQPTAPVQGRMQAEQLQPAQAPPQFGLKMISFAAKPEGCGKRLDIQA